MLHIKPISEQEASVEIQKYYHDIKQTLGVNTVPLIFLYMANYEKYLVYAWEKIKANIKSDYFHQQQKEIINFGKTATKDIYNPSSLITLFIEELPILEKQQINTTATSLEKINCQLLLLTLGIREGLKGLFPAKDLLLQTNTKTNNEKNIMDEFMQASAPSQTNQNNQLREAEKMLAPIFGSQSIIVSHYPDFFARIYLEMEALTKKVEYLEKRVMLEQKVLQIIKLFPYPLGFSYSELIHLTEGKPYFYELLYLLIHTFPAQFPRLLFTSCVMEYVLKNKNQSEVVAV